MLEAQIPKDIRKYESKMVGPFTLRQLICFIAAVVLAYFAYKGITSFSTADVATPVCVLVAAPIIMVGWVKPYGMPMEKFIQTSFISTILAPKVRKYKTKNQYRLASTRLQKMEQKEYKKRLKKDKKLAQENKKYQAYK